MGVDEHTIEVAGAPVFFRRAPAVGATTLYLHSVPTSSADWDPFLAVTGGVAPDLIGFGRSSKAGHLDYSLDSYAAFVEQFLGALELDRVALVGHGWGAAIGLVLAQRHPERVTRLAILDPVPLLEGFTWPRMARWWRRPVLGELLMGSVSRRVLGRALRGGSARADAWPDERVEEVWQQFDQGTQRAMLRLHRSVDAAGLAHAGGGLAALDQPVLVMWGELDRWLDPAFAGAYAVRLPNATAERVPGAGHWPWLDQPKVIDRVAAFVSPSSQR